MKLLSRFFNRVAGFFRRKRFDADLAEEIRLHLEQRVDENIAAGLLPEEARHAALRRFGGVEQVKERCRDERWRAIVWTEHLGQDLRYAVRSLYQSPGFTTVVLLSLALGIGANTAIFSLLNDFLLRTLPVKNPQELVLFRYYSGGGDWIPGATEGNGGKDAATGRSWHGSFSLAMFERFRAQHPGLADVFAFAPLSQPGVLIDGEPEVAVSGQFVSGNYFSALGVTAALGRTLTAADEHPAAEPVAVISHRYWQNRFTADPGVLGKTIRLNQVPTTIVGVTPPGFAGTMQAGQSPDISVPLGLFERFYPTRDEKLQPWYWWVHLMGRLEPGATAEQARARLAPAFLTAARETWEVKPRPPGSVAGEMATPTLAFEPGARGENDKRREYALSLRLLMGLVALVLLTACANVANLLLARGANRRREIAVRLALGASRSRIVRQLLAESLLLAAAGAALGMLLARWGASALLALRIFGGTPITLDLPLDARVLGFTLAVTGATALLFGLLPALRATRLDVSAEFQGGARTLGGGARSRLSQVLMAAQIALSFVLLVTAGLFVRTLENLRRVDVGFNRHGLVLFRLEAAAAGLEPDRFLALHERVRERLARIPGVAAATYSDIELVSGRRMGRGLTFPGREPAGVYFTDVAPNFFGTLQMPILSGRGFTEGDGATAPKVAVVNQAFVRAFFADESALGRRFHWQGRSGPENAIEIAGISHDGKYTDLRDTIEPTVYTPLAQQAQFDGVANYVVRVAGDPRTLFSAIRAVVRDIEPALPVRNLRTQDEQIDRLNSQPILFARLSGFFGLLTLGVACVGLYGLMSYRVLRRTGEIGVRMALGARPTDVMRMILRESLGLVGIGVAAGLGLAIAATRLVATMLYGLSPTDPPTFVALALALGAVVLLAALLPARRATRIDPMTALRAE